MRKAPSEQVYLRTDEVLILSPSLVYWWLGLTLRPLFYLIISIMRSASIFMEPRRFQLCRWTDCLLNSRPYFGMGNTSTLTLDPIETYWDLTGKKTAKGLRHITRLRTSFELKSIFSEPATYEERGERRVKYVSGTWRSALFWFDFLDHRGVGRRRRPPALLEREVSVGWYEADKCTIGCLAVEYDTYGSLESAHTTKGENLNDILILQHQTSKNTSSH